MITETDAKPETANGRLFLDRAALLATPDVQQEDVWVPEWKSYVRVRGLTGRDRDAYETSITVGRGKNQEINTRNARAKLVVLCVIDDAGNRLFTDADVRALGEKSAAALQRVFDVCRRLSGLSDEDMEEMTEGFD